MSNRLFRTRTIGPILLFPLLLAPVARSASNIGAPIARQLGESAAGDDAGRQLEGSLGASMTDISAFVGAAMSMKPLNAGAPSTTRGTTETKLFSRIAPSVVVVSTNKGLGSGVVVVDGQTVLTNYHVVQDNREVAVAFKPKLEGAAPLKQDLHRATVIRVDEVADLALLRLVDVPTPLAPVALGSLSAIEVGSDVHAIGHPAHEFWTYTKGIVSQVRRNYEWQADDDKISHEATVIQTQTPINPGNSGGPLLNDQGELIGINTFGDTGYQGLNFAVSIEDIRSFLASKVDRIALPAAVAPESESQSCEPRELGRKRWKEPPGDAQLVDANCDGSVDIVFVTPDDHSKPLMAMIDDDGDGKIDIVVEDTNRDGKWDTSWIDLDHDGKPDYRGFHPDGGLLPSRMEAIASK